jgi:23S rRNA (adenine2503-C2)-methyltransferase
MPVNKRWNLAELIAACHYYVEKSGRRISFEWAAIAGKNDTEEEAHKLGALLQGLLCHVNIIPLNPTGGYAGMPSDMSAIRNFIEILNQYSVSATVRVRRGIDIDAGCGQLKSKVIRPTTAKVARP